MKADTLVKPRFTLGTVIMWISFLLPFLFLPVHLSPVEIYYLFYAVGGLLGLGFLIYCWEDHRAKKPFPWVILVYVFVMLCAYGVVSPVLMSAAHVQAQVSATRPN